MKRIAYVLPFCLLALALSCQTPGPWPDVTRGGRLRVAQPAGPETFNPLLAGDSDSLTIINCLHARLIRVNHQTLQTELELAESAELSPDGRALTMRLREGLKFSDGHRLTADDVVFTFRVIYDPEIPSPVADIVKVGGQPIQVEKLDERALRFTFPDVTADAEMLFGDVHILPKHILEPIVERGEFQAAWGIAAPPEQVVGAGPFRLQAYEQGQRTRLTRNPHYWKKDGEGNALPYVDEIELPIIPDKGARLLRFQQNELDLHGSLRADDIEPLQPLVQVGAVTVIDLGPSLISEFLWFNLNPGRHPATGKPYVDPIKLKWFGNVEFRRAMALAVDRQAMVEAAFLGKATPLAGPFSSGEGQWYNSQLQPFDYAPEQARERLREIGFRDRDGNGVVEDERGHPVKFTLITNAGNQMRETMGLIIQEDLKTIGIEVAFVPVDAGTLHSNIMNDFDYEACLLALSTSVGPGGKENFLLSSGTAHWWHPGQTTPATPWEAEIDRLMAQQARTLDRAERKRIFDRVQAIMREHLPVIPLVARNLLIAAHRRVGNLKPGIIHDHVLWNAEELFLR